MFSGTCYNVEHSDSEVILHTTVISIIGTRKATDRVQQTELHQTLPHVWKWAKLINSCPKFGVPFLQLESQKLPFLDAFLQLCNLLANIFGIKRKKNYWKIQVVLCGLAEFHEVHKRINRTSILLTPHISCTAVYFIASHHTRISLNGTPSTCCNILGSKPGSKRLVKICGQFPLHIGSPNTQYLDVNVFETELDMENVKKRHSKWQRSHRPLHSCMSIEYWMQKVSRYLVMLGCALDWTETVQHRHKLANRNFYALYHMALFLVTLGEF